MADWYERTQQIYADKPEALATFQRTYGELQSLGRAGYMDLYPEVFRKFAATRAYAPSWEESRIGDLSALLGEYSGPEASFIRWLINKRVRELKYKVARERGITAARPPEYKAAPVPEWMKPYIETTTETMPAGRGMARREGPQTREVGELRPLGAQEELTPEQMALMGGYQAWQRAGAPTTYSEEALRGMSDWQRWWDPYVRLSQSLFPKQTKLGARWMPAKQ